MKVAAVIIFFASTVVAHSHHKDNEGDEEKHHKDHEEKHHKDHVEKHHKHHKKDKHKCKRYARGLLDAACDFSVPKATLCSTQCRQWWKDNVEPHTVKGECAHEVHKLLKKYGKRCGATKPTTAAPTEKLFMDRNLSAQATTTTALTQEPSADTTSTVVGHSHHKDNEGDEEKHHKDNEGDEEKHHKDHEEKHHKDHEEKHHKDHEEKHHKDHEEKHHKDHEEKHHKDHEEKHHKDHKEDKHKCKQYARGLVDAACDFSVPEATLCSTQCRQWWKDNVEPHTVKDECAHEVHKLLKKYGKRCGATEPTTAAPTKEATQATTTTTTNLSTQATTTTAVMQEPSADTSKSALGSYITLAIIGAVTAISLIAIVIRFFFIRRRLRGPGRV